MPTRLIDPGFRLTDANGVILPGGKLYTYEAGTSTPKATYSDAALTVANANPVVADAGGMFGPIFADVGSYKLVAQTSGGGSVWTADPVDGASGASAAPGAGIRNLLINGNFIVDQRGATSVADDAYCLDGWYVLCDGGNVTVAQSTGAGSNTYKFITLTQPDVAAKRIGLAQILEGDVSRYYRLNDVVLSGRIRCSISTPIRYAILSWTGTLDTVTSDVVLNWASGSYTAGGFFLAASVTVQAVGVVTPVANVITDIPILTANLANNVNNVVVMFWTEQTVAQNVTFDMRGLQLEAGTAATAFENLPMQMQLARCQRYYFKTVGTQFIAGNASAGGQTRTAEICFPVTMRAAPTAVAGSFSGLTNATNGRLLNVSVDGAQAALDSVAAGNFSGTHGAGATFNASL